MPSFDIEMLIVAACLLCAIVLGLPAAIQTIRLWKQGLSFHRDEAANDERFVA
jgi:hypothetical protein